MASMGKGAQWTGGPGSLRQAAKERVVRGMGNVKMQREDWLVLLISNILAILLPWWVIVPLPLLPVLLVFLLCGIFLRR